LNTLILYQYLKKVEIKIKGLYELRNLHISESKEDCAKLFLEKARMKSLESLKIDWCSYLSNLEFLKDHKFDNLWVRVVSKGLVGLARESGSVGSYIRMKWSGRITEEKK